MKRLWFVSLVWTIALIIHAQVFGAGFFEQGTGPPGGYPSVATFTHVGTGDITATDNVTSAKGFFSSILRRGGFDVLTSNDNVYKKQDNVLGLLTQPIQGKDLTIDNSVIIDKSLTVDNVTVDNSLRLGNNVSILDAGQTNDLGISPTLTLTVPRTTAVQEFDGISVVKTLAKTGTASTDVYMIGAAIEPRIGATNTRDWTGAFTGQAGIFTTNNTQAGATGSVGVMDGLVVSADLSSMAIGNRRGIMIRTPAIYGTATVDYLYGLFIDSQAGGATSTYGIYNNDSPIFTQSSNIGNTPAFVVKAIPDNTAIGTAIRASSVGGSSNYALLVPPGEGKVGIGTLTPVQQLQVNVSTSGTTNDLIGFSTTGGGGQGGLLGINTTDNVIYLRLNTDTGYSWQFQSVTGTPLVTITNAGAVRIHNLSGTGTRSVVASPTGVLSAP